MTKTLAKALATVEKAVDALPIEAYAAAVTHVEALKRLLAAAGR